MSNITEPSAAPVRERSLFAQLVPLFAAVFLAYLTLGLALATLPKYIHESLGFGNLTVGIVIGIQSVAALLSRHFAGTTADLKGTRRAVNIGSIFCTLSGCLHLLSTYFAADVGLGVVILGRLVLGLGESLLVTGALSWGINLAGPKLTGKVMAWNGIAMYGAIAAGAPLAIPLEHYLGITGVFGCLFVLPILGWLFTRMAQVVTPIGRSRVAFYRLVHLIWQPGVGLALATVGFGGIASFVTLYFAQKNWPGSALVVTTFGATYIGVRLFFAHLPDRFGGARVALACLLIEIVGQLCLWLAVSPTMAFVGAALTGAGFSLVFPAFGITAVQRVAPENRGVALGAYVAFFDLALGTTGPLAGLIANEFSYSMIYLFGAVAAALAALLAFRLRKAV